MKHDRMTKAQRKAHKQARKARQCGARGKGWQGAE